MNINPNAVPMIGGKNTNELAARIFRKRML